MKTVAVIQARMGSTRLPGKAMMEILGKPVVHYVFERAKQAKALDGVWLATTVDPSDDVLAAWADKQKIPCYRGSVEDVLDRYYQAAKKAGADIVVRLTGDCPLLDPGVIDRAVSEYKKRGCDYLSTGRLTSTFPDGLDTEVFSFGILERAWKEAKIKSEREHVTPYVWKHPELFEVAAIDNDTDLSKERWTIDTAQDFGLIKKIIEWSDEHGSATDMASVMKTLASHPEWREMNSGIKRNEGYIE